MGKKDVMILFRRWGDREDTVFLKIDNTRSGPTDHPGEEALS